MSAALRVLRDWAAQQATTDPDTAARPVWAQIRDEVGHYLDETDPTQKESLFDE